jgi:hypothetical protein
MLLECALGQSFSAVASGSKPACLCADGSGGANGSPPDGTGTPSSTNTLSPAHDKHAKAHTQGM